MIINERIRKIVKDVLNEELGINNDVHEASKELLNSIIQNASMANDYKPLYNSNGCYYTDIFRYDLIGKTIKVKYTVVQFPTKKDYLDYRKTNNITGASIRAMSDLSEIFLSVNLVIYEGHIDDMIYDQVQHELNHAFQQIMCGKSYQHGSLRKRMNNTTSKSNDKDIQSANFILYMSRKFEQDAFANGLYALLQQNGCTNDVIENSALVHNLRVLQKVIEQLSNVENKPKFKKMFGIPLREILAKGKLSEKRLIKLCNRVIFKYGQDTQQDIRNFIIQ